MPRKTDTAVVSTIGIDTGKNALHMVGLDERGAIVLREKVSRLRIAAGLVNVQPCLIGIEAGMATHYLARELVALGHEVIICGLAKGKTSRTQHDDVPNGHDLPPFMSQVINRW
jgi:transposase